MRTNEISVLLALLPVQVALACGLVVQMWRRRQAERQLAGSEAALSASHDRIRTLARRLLTAQDDERSRVARELHDDISQQVALLAIDLELVGLDRARSSDAATLAREVLPRVESIANSLTALSHRLHPAKLTVTGLVPALSALQRELSQPDLRITFTHEHVPSPLPHEVTLCLFRVVQEALQNAVKHAAARQVSIHLGRAKDGLSLTIVDDGVGFDVANAWGRGLGLISMDERLEAIGGALKIYSAVDAGTRLEIVAPVRLVPCVTCAAV